MNTWQRATQAAENLTRAIDEAHENVRQLMEPLARNIEAAKAAIASATGYPPENFSLSVGEELQQAMIDGYTLAAERAGLTIIPGTLRVTHSFWLRRPKSKKRRQWKKWQRLHAEKYLRVTVTAGG